VRARLLKLARENGEDFQFSLTRYANERLLFRIAQSPYRTHFILKGASLFTVWTGAPHRATRDLDLLGLGDTGARHIRQVFSEILTLAVPDDGIRFDLNTLAVSSIREEQDFDGVRVRVFATLAAARIRLQIDVGFGDAVTPEPVSIHFPGLLDFPGPQLLAYQRETAIAEKFEAIVKLGMANSRMKDFYDIRVLARDFDFDGEVLASAIRATFHARLIPIPTRLPVALTSAFAEDATKKTQWSGFVRKAGVRDTGLLVDTVAAVAAFLEEPMAAAAQDISFRAVWHAPGPWDRQGFDRAAEPGGRRR